MKSTSLKLQPVGFPVYHAISELNRSFEDCIKRLEQLVGIKLVPSERLRAYQVAVEGIRAAVNQDHAEVINEREINNNAYYERLRFEWESQYEDPTEMLPMHRVPFATA
jgi:hypothetical protein